jgi:glc operon protein GlcG
MRKAIVTSLAVCATILFGGEARAQTYGSPGVNLEQAQKAIAAAAAEAKKNNWPLAIAVVTNGGYLVSFARMDGTQLASIAIAQQKAKAAATFRRPTKAFADRLAQGGAGLALLTLEGVVASEGGIPITNAQGQVIGAIGCSGATGAQDHQACEAGVNALK